jgi:hypothetical protein
VVHIRPLSQKAIFLNALFESALFEVDQLDAHKNDTRRTRIVCGSERNTQVRSRPMGEAKYQTFDGKMLDKLI